MMQALSYELVDTCSGGVMQQVVLSLLAVQSMCLPMQEKD